MPVVYLDRMDTLSMVERLGVVRSLTRKAKILFDISELTAVADEDKFNLPQLALDALSAAPYALLPFSVLDLPGLSNLVLIERSPRIAEDDPGTVEVELKYEHILDGPNQSLFAPENGLLFGKGKCSIREKTTNFFYPYGDKTAPKTQILVGHEFDKSEMGVAGYLLGPDFPFVVIQGGEITIPFAEGNFSVEGIIYTSSPHTTAKQFVNKINKETWLQEEAGHWLCSDVHWEMLDYSDSLGPKYKFSFEFQLNSDGWQPSVTFKDERTGRPPAKVKEATDETPITGVEIYFVMNQQLNSITGQAFPAGIWDVPALTEVDFAELFQAVFEGDPPTVVS